MSILLINGSYCAKGAHPEGGSIHFAPQNPNEWNLVGGILRRGPAATRRDRRAGDLTQARHPPSSAATPRHVPPTTC